MRTQLAGLLLAALGLLAAPGAEAQKKSPPKAPGSAAPVEVKVGQVNDRRGSFARCAISLELPSVPSSEVGAARVLVRKAVDDTGRNLVPEDAAEKRMEPTRAGRFGAEEAGQDPLSLTLELKNPARKATVVKEVRGEIELYSPGKDPDAVATVAKFLAGAGQPLKSPALAANGVSITVVTKAQLEAEKKTQAEKKRQEAKKDGIAGEMLESIVSGFLDMFFTPGEDDVVLKVADPRKRVLDIAYVDASGEEKTVGRMEREGYTVLSSWGEKPGPDWGLRVKMQTPKTLARQVFVLKDVALP